MFEQRFCWLISCTSCGYIYDVDEGCVHFPSSEAAIMRVLEEFWVVNEYFVLCWECRENFTMFPEKNYPSLSQRECTVVVESGVEKHFNSPELAYVWINASDQGEVA